MHNAPYSLENKVALITGSGRDIGKGIALCMAEAGADIVVTARTKEQIEQTAAEIRHLGRQAIAVPFDAREAEQMTMVAERALEEFGRIDIWVNNVGTPTQWDTVDVNEKGWDSIFKENLKTTFLGTQTASKIMRERNIKGSIINISSASKGSVITAYPEGPAYGAAKAGVNSITLSWAQAMAPYGIRVNCVIPGQILHPVSMEFANFKDPATKAAWEAKIPLRRLGTPEDIGWACAFLASDAASYITGVCLNVDGGLW
ncbi:MAG: SDR family oxidoreductase [Dehalococcoidales bacterium]|nr:SDR family oxidoreductase [Dehalococcoidales bacterium]